MGGGAETAVPGVSEMSREEKTRASQQTRGTEGGFSIVRIGGGSNTRNGRQQQQGARSILAGGRRDMAAAKPTSGARRRLASRRVDPEDVEATAGGDGDKKPWLPLELSATELSTGAAGKDALLAVASVGWWHGLYQVHFLWRSCHPCIDRSVVKTCVKHSLTTSFTNINVWRALHLGRNPGRHHSQRYYAEAGRCCTRCHPRYYSQGWYRRRKPKGADTGRGTAYVRHTATPQHHSHTPHPYLRV